jgi:hypothetical protein
MPTTLIPELITGIANSCTGVGSVKPISPNALSNDLATLSSSKLLPMPQRYKSSLVSDFSPSRAPAPE